MIHVQIKPTAHRNGLLKDVPMKWNKLRKNETNTCITESNKSIILKHHMITNHCSWCWVWAALSAQLHASFADINIFCIQRNDKVIRTLITRQWRHRTDWLNTIPVQVNADDSCTTADLQSAMYSARYKTSGTPADQTELREGEIYESTNRNYWQWKRINGNANSVYLVTSSQESQSVASCTCDTRLVSKGALHALYIAVEWN